MWAELDGRYILEKILQPNIAKLEGALVTVDADHLRITFPRVSKKMTKEEFDRALLEGEEYRKQREKSKEPVIDGEEKAPSKERH